MGKRIIMILGNGFSIDLINELKKTDKVCLTNLFKNGDKVPWPGNEEPGFLSHRYCPELWKLGARPNSSQEYASKLVEDIITCANVSVTTDEPSINKESSNVYIRAYHELVSYLKYLFVYYNIQIKDAELEKIIQSWGWSELLKNINENSSIENVTIITYNYDIFLERVLKLLGIEYQMAGFDTATKKFCIIKPHGSISYRARKTINKENFMINYNQDASRATMDMLLVDDTLDPEKISNVNTMIPPSGESKRYELVWSATLRKEVLDQIDKCSEGDDVIIGGISYCGVDRQELDEIFVRIDSSVDVKIVNPDASSTLGAVISSIYDHYIHYTKSDILGGLYNA